MKWEEIKSKFNSFQFVPNLFKANYKPNFSSPVPKDQPQCPSNILTVTGEEKKKRKLKACLGFTTRYKVI